MNLQKLSRWFVTVILCLACVALVLLVQAQSEGGADSTNKCHTEWDFCNSGTEAENAYHWRLGWCVAAVESGAASVSVSACMGQEEGTVSYPRSLSPAPPSSASSSSASSAPAGAEPNKCYTEWDFCNSGTEEENAYFWRLGWYAAASERGEVAVSLDAFMDEGPVPIGVPLPDETQDEPWSREICWAKGGGWECGWYATLPPEMLCAVRAVVPPYDCREHGPAGPHILVVTHAAGTAAAGG